MLYHKYMTEVYIKPSGLKIVDRPLARLPPSQDGGRVDVSFQWTAALEAASSVYIYIGNVRVSGGPLPLQVNE